MARLYVVDGVNLGVLREREPEVHGSLNLSGIKAPSRKPFPEAPWFGRAGREGGRVAGGRKPATCDGPVLDPGARTHYPYAIHDALKVVTAAEVEAHVSNAGEDRRRAPVVSPAVGQLPSGVEA